MRWTPWLAALPLTATLALGPAPAAPAVDCSKRAAEARRIEGDMQRLLGTRTPDKADRMRQLRSEFQELKSCPDEPPAAPEEEASPPVDGRCEALPAQLERDKDALRRQGAGSRRATEELEEWGQEADEAQKAALQKATDFLVEGVTDKLQALSAARLETLEREIGKAGDTSQLKRLRDLRRERERLEVAKERLGKETDRYFDNADEMWSTIHGSTDTATKSVTSLESYFRDVERNDPEFYAKLEKYGLVDRAQDYHKKLLARFPPRYLPLYKLGDFLVNYGYEATRYAAAWQGIARGNDLTECQLVAVSVLSDQIRCTTDRLKRCRTGQPPGECKKPERNTSACSTAASGRTRF